jgi:Amt family ammonium transporter
VASSAGGSGGGHQHSSVPFVLLGAGWLNIGWLGFNSGSALVSGYLAGRAFANTQLAASAALGAWAIMEVMLGGEDGKWFSGTPTGFGAATGAVVGLVAITPACGYVSQMVSILIGTLAVVVCYFAVKALAKTGVDDRLECLPCHGVAGMVGIILTGFFANTREGSPNNGLFYGNPKQLGVQLLGLVVTLALCVAGTTAAFWMTVAVGWVFKKSPRVPLEQQRNVDETVSKPPPSPATSRRGSLQKGAAGIMPSPLLSGAAAVPLPNAVVRAKRNKSFDELHLGHK